MIINPEKLRKRTQKEAHTHIRWLKPICKLICNYDKIKKKQYEYISYIDGDIPFRCDLWSYIERCIFYFWYYEPEVAHLIKRIIKKWDICLDIWTNIWDHALIMWKQTWANGKVYTFEPSEMIYEKLCYNTSLSNMTNITNNKYGIATQNGVINFYEDKEASNEWEGSIHKDNLKNPKKVEIQIKTLEKFIEETPLEKIDFIKIDIEWEDTNLILKNTKIINKYLPKILFECHKKTDIAILEDLYPNYDFFATNPKNYHNLRKISKKIMPKIVKDVLMIPKKDFK